ncbi:hypothetical protein MBLNU230_g3671t1 [Neophaeotheca triangularis]
MAASLLVYLATAQSAAAVTCPAPDLSFAPITNVELSNGNSRRGLYMPLGTPAQNVSFLPGHFLNSTWVYNTSAADTTCPEGFSTTRCITIRGGLFDPSESSTFESRDNLVDAVASESDPNRERALYNPEGSLGADSFAVGDILLEDYPIGMPQFAVGGVKYPQGIVGLGFNSTILTALRDAGHIETRSFGFWWGLHGATENSQMDGGIVFGGYDAAKTSGPNLTTNLVAPSSQCPSGILLTISEIQLAFPNGTESSVMSSAMATCIRIDFPGTIAMNTQPYYENFERDTDSSTYGRS